MNSTIDRRKFLKTASSAALLSYFGVIAGCNVTDGNNDPDTDSGGTDSPPPTNGSGEAIVIDDDQVIIDLSKDSVADLAEEGGWLLINDAQMLVVNTDGEEIRALTSVCTHAGCDNSWQYGNDVFTCTCHNSRFQNDGAVISGPATRDLRSFSVSRDGDIVTIDRS